MVQQATPYWSRASGGKAMALTKTCAFTSTNPVFHYVETFADNGLQRLESVYVDNSNSYVATTLFFQQTGQKIVVAGLSQGYYRVLSGPSMLDVTISNTSYAYNPIATVMFLSEETEPATWGATSAAQNQFAWSRDAGISANATMTLVLGVVGGTGVSYLSGVCVSGGGATAASIVPVVVSNVSGDPSSGGTWLHYTIGVPAGVALAISPLIVLFHPPLQLNVGSASVLQVGAFGAGNVSASANAWGFSI